uniref:Uncharacterized protein n=1 Tax=Micrurus carvalhoi TaxID=3147026 RepID=A0A2H6MVD5_9SAUR
MTILAPHLLPPWVRKYSSFCLQDGSLQRIEHIEERHNLFVMEYYKDNIWQGLVCFVISVVASIFYFKLYEAHQDLSSFFIFSMVSSLWFLVSNLCKRRLIVNHIRQYYQFYIRGILWQEGPLHQIYVRLLTESFSTASSSTDTAWRSSPWSA